MNVDIWYKIFEYLEDKHKYLGICKDTSHEVIYKLLNVRGNNYNNVSPILSHFNKKLRTINTYNFIIWLFKDISNDNKHFGGNVCKYITLRAIEFLIKVHTLTNMYTSDLKMIIHDANNDKILCYENPQNYVKDNFY